jgi:hypothetical protein
VAPVPADAYDFPVRPGTPAWATFTTSTAQVAALQVPNSTLQSMSTPGLIATCLDYPLLSDIIASRYLQRSIRVILANFNGYDELRQRPEAAALLLNRYQSMRATCLPEQTQQGAYSFTFSYVEIILAQDEYLAQLSAGERRSLLREALTKYDEKMPLVDNVYGYYGLKTVAFVMARVMQAEQFRPFMSAVGTDTDLQYFTTEAEFRDKPQTLETVVRYAKQFN